MAFTVQHEQAGSQNNHLLIKASKGAALVWTFLRVSVQLKPKDNKMYVIIYILNVHTPHYSIFICLSYYHLYMWWFPVRMMSHLTSELTGCAVIMFCWETQHAVVAWAPCIIMNIHYLNCPSSFSLAHPRRKKANELHNNMLPCYCFEITQVFFACAIISG